VHLSGRDLTLGYRPSMIPQIMVNHRSNLVALGPIFVLLSIRPGSRSMNQIGRQYGKGKD
jgi:hypothetical protein